MDSTDFEASHSGLSADMQQTGPEADQASGSNGTVNGVNENGGSGCYDELFPALPGGLGGSPAPIPNGKTASWGLTGSKSVPAVRAISKTEFFVIPSEERRHKDLPSAKFGGSGDVDQASERERNVVKRIGTETSTSIELLVSKNDGGLTVVINGKADRVIEAKKNITAQLVREAQADLMIPKDHHKHILGAKAAKLKQLENETATKINVPRPEENSEMISIKGPKEGIAVAVHRIQTISDELAKNDREVIEVEKKYHVFILGPNNKSIEQLRQQTKTKIRVPPLHLKDEATITITGEKEGVAEAKKAIADIYKQCKANIKDTSMQVPKEQHKYILGRGGQTLQDMFEKTGVWIECTCLDNNHTKVPPQDQESETIKLLGEPDKLGQALSLVYEKANSVIKYEMTAPSWLHKYLIGKKGENINRIRENFKDAYVEFVDHSIRIEGLKESVQSVRQLLQSEIEQITSQTSCAEISAPVSYHPHIIGKSGANVNRLKQELNVKIHIPSATDSTQHPDVITIEGEPQDVIKAKKELEEMIEKMKNEAVMELKCESRLHGQIIGSGGEKINELRNKFNQVSISVPSAAKNSDIITIRGDKRDVEECYKQLSGVVKELQRTNYKIDVNLYKQFVKYLQNPKGRTIIQNIQKETGAKISIPKEGVGNEQVAVIGEKDKVEKAKAMLIDAQRKNSDIVEKEVLVPNKMHGSLLRSKRALLNSILEEAGCSPSEIDVEFPPSGSNSDRVVLSGSKDAVEKTRKRLIEESNEHALASYTEELKAKPQYMKYLIGRKGANIHKIREKTTARVIFPAEDSEDRETIVIIGKEQAVKLARKELESSIAALENDTEDTVQIPVKHHKHFVARRGEILEQVAEEFGGVQVSFPKTNSGSDVVTIKGPKEFVAGAKQNLLERTKELESQITLNCFIPQVHHRAVMGAKGSKVQSITKEFNVQVKFPDRQQNGEEVEENTGDENDSRNIIVITGLKERCEGAKKALEDLVPISIDVPVDATLHRYIIGAKGKDVRELMDKYDVNIKVPQPEEKIDSVKVTGCADNVAKCREDLEERIKKLMVEMEDRKLKSFSLTIDVAAKHHPKIVGRRGAVVSKIRDRHHVQIQFPAKGAEDTDTPVSNTITVTGYEADAYAARDEILKMVQDLEDMVTKEIKLDHRVHSRIIGQRGRRVRKIMDDYNVDIKFPRNDAADPDLVEVTGAEDNVIDAISYLQDQEDELMESVQEETQYQRPRQETLNNIFQSPHGGPGTRQGFVVQGAPWNQSVPDSESQSDFPSFGGKAQNGSSVAWGPRR